jgi:hypothetical protein
MREQVRKRTLKKIGDFEYPDLGTFLEALTVAQEALSKYAGIIPNNRAAEILGYKVTDPNAISGSIYKKINDLKAFGLFTRERGTLKTTTLAVDALDPYNTSKAAEGKARAVRNVGIVAKAFDAWNGLLPDDTAFPAKLTQITGISWQEAQNHVESLKKLFNETFQYLRTSAGVVGPVTAETPLPPVPGRREIEITTEVTAKPFGELRTTLGSIVINDTDSYKLAKQLLDLLGAKFTKQAESEKES